MPVFSKRTFVHGCMANPLSSLQARSSPAMKYDFASALLARNCSAAHLVGLKRTGPFSNQYSSSRKLLVNVSHSARGPLMSQF